MAKYTNAVQRSPLNILANAKKARRAYDQTWNTAARAPMFCRVSKKKSAEGKVKRTYRTTRLVASHAYNIAASGAALHASCVAEADCDLLRLEAAPENKRSPWLPRVTKGARLVLEQFLCAVAQEAAHKGHVVRKGSGNAVRLNKQHVKLGWESVFESVFGASALLPKAVYTMDQQTSNGKKRTKRRVAGGEEEDYVPPEDEEAEVVHDLTALQPEE